MAGGRGGGLRHDVDPAVFRVHDVSRPAVALSRQARVSRSRPWRDLSPHRRHVYAVRPRRTAGRVGLVDPGHHLVARDCRHRAQDGARLPLPAPVHGAVPVHGLADARGGASALLRDRVGRPRLDRRGRGELHRRRVLLCARLPPLPPFHVASLRPRRQRLPPHRRRTVRQRRAEGRASISADRAPVLASRGRPPSGTTRSAS
jgi:hypothetical protein